MNPSFSVSQPSYTSVVEGKLETKSQSPFPKKIKRPTLRTAPETPQPRPRSLRGWPGDPAASDGAQLSRARGATWWSQRALPGFPALST